MSAVQKEVRAEELVLQLKLLRKTVAWCVFGVVTGFLTLAVCIVEPVLKSTFDHVVGMTSACATGFLFLISALMCWIGLRKSRKGVY